MRTIRKLDHTGDTAFTFDEANAAAVKEAEALFKKLAKEGRQAFAVNRGEGLPDKRVDRFEQIEDDTVFIPRIQGG